MSASRLTIVGKKGKSKVLLEDVSDDGGSSFARALGSVDFHTRDRGLQALTLFLQKSTKLSPLACLKLWKGLFYCFWHSDKAPVQVSWSIDCFIVPYVDVLPMSEQMHKGRSINFGTV